MTPWTSRQFGAGPHTQPFTLGDNLECSIGVTCMFWAVGGTHADTRRTERANSTQEGPPAWNRTHDLLAVRRRRLPPRHRVALVSNVSSPYKPPEDSKTVTKMEFRSRRERRKIERGTQKNNATGREEMKSFFPCGVHIVK